MKPHIVQLSPEFSFDMLCHGETCNMPSGRLHTNEQRLQQPQGHERFGGFGTVRKKKKISLCGLKFIETCIDVNLDEPLILKLPCKKYQN